MSVAAHVIVLGRLMTRMYCGNYYFVLELVEPEMDNVLQNDCAEVLNEHYCILIRICLSFTNVFFLMCIFLPYFIQLRQYCVTVHSTFHSCHSRSLITVITVAWGHPGQ